MLMDAIEVKFEQDPDREAEERQEFKWDIVEYSEDFLKLKFHFESPE